MAQEAQAARHSAGSKSPSCPSSSATASTCRSTASTTATPAIRRCRCCGTCATYCDSPAPSTAAKTARAAPIWCWWTARRPQRSVADGQTGRQAGHHGRRPGRQPRWPASGAAGLHRRGCDRLRLLHAGLADRLDRSAQAQEATQMTRHRHAAQSLPLRLPDARAPRHQARGRRQGRPAMSHL
jgi:hypothetical protein